MERAQSLTPKGSRKLTVIREGQGTLTFDLADIQEDKANDVSLHPGDKVFVPSK